MNPDTTKISISLPTELYLRLEAERKRRGLTRSALVAEMASRLVREREHEERVVRDTAAYAKHPYTDGENAWMDEGARLLFEERWEEQPAQEAG